MQSNQPPVALITGGSAGLGFVVARTFLDAGYRVVIVGRTPERLNQAVERLAADTDTLTAQPCDLTRREEVERLIGRVDEQYGRLDVLINCVGASDRGLVENLEPDKLQELIAQNVCTALLCSQAALPMLEKTRGVIVNVGSLAAKVGARYIGGYTAAKHALAGLTQQMRLELKPRGVHVALVNPGPIRRDDAGTRYDDQIDPSVPQQASQPGAGARVKGLPPEKVAAAILRSVQRRRIDVVMPGYMRVLIAVGHACPRLGDWLLLKFTSAKQ
jgi:NAD(P)-dependent dehydrogenase (short-subunit alcohol dehydrogenase family)